MPPLRSGDPPLQEQPLSDPLLRATWRVNDRQSADWGPGLLCGAAGTAGTPLAGTSGPERRGGLASRHCPGHLHCRRGPCAQEVFAHGEVDGAQELWSHLGVGGLLCAGNTSHESARPRMPSRQPRRDQDPETRPAVGSLPPPADGFTAERLKPGSQLTLNACTTHTCSQVRMRLAAPIWDSGQTPTGNTGPDGMSAGQGAKVKDRSEQSGEVRLEEIKGPGMSL